MNDNPRMDDFCKNSVTNGYSCKNDATREITSSYCSIEMLCTYFMLVKLITISYELVFCNFIISMHIYRVICKLQKKYLTTDPQMFVRCLSFIHPRYMIVYLQEQIGMLQEKFQHKRKKK